MEIRVEKTYYKRMSYDTDQKDIVKILSDDYKRMKNGHRLS